VIRFKASIPRLKSVSQRPLTASQRVFPHRSTPPSQSAAKPRQIAGRHPSIPRDFAAPCGTTVNGGSKTDVHAFTLTGAGSGGRSDEIPDARAERPRSAAVRGRAGAYRRCCHTIRRSARPHTLLLKKVHHRERRVDRRTPQADDVP
jgi:hypothetical protein